MSTENKVVTGAGIETLRDWTRALPTKTHASTHSSNGSDPLTIEQSQVYELETDLGKKYEKPSTGIPASDIASGVIPTKTSDLTNDSGFLTSHQSLSAYRTSSEQDTIDAGKVDKVTGSSLVEDTKVENYDSHISSILNPHGVTKTQVGLGNVDNTSDVNKPISNATQTAINGLQGQIDALVSKSDVVDVVATHTDLQNYDTSKLLTNDVVKVLDDSTHNNSRSYYRWVITGSTGAWNYIGSEAVGYTKTQADERFVQQVEGKGLSTNDYDATEKGNVADNTNARHTHDNISVLNGISSYLKTASVESNTLTLTKQDGSTVTFQGGGATPMTAQTVDTIFDSIVS